MVKNSIAIIRRYDIIQLKQKLLNKCKINCETKGVKKMMTRVENKIRSLLPTLKETYMYLHSHPELSMQEVETARYISKRLKDLGLEVHEGIGGTGVAAILRNGRGPVVMMRADMDALPMKEETGLPYASQWTTLNRTGEMVPVSHMCGHDMHMTWLLGTLEILSETKEDWQGTVVGIFQPGEETAEGSKAMIEGGLSDMIPKPDIILGQHLMQYCAGTVAIRGGQILTAGDSLEVTFFGKGGHGGMPQNAIDPVIMASSAVLRLQTIASREVAPSDQVVITVGSIQAGKVENIIPHEARLKLNVRTTDEKVREKVLEAIRRICEAEALASGASLMPEIKEINSFPLTVNDEGAAELIEGSFRKYFGNKTLKAEPIGASEDFSRFGRAWNVPYVYWFVGGTKKEIYEEALKSGTTGSLPGPHSPHWAPSLLPTLAVGIETMIIAANNWLRQK